MNTPLPTICLAQLQDNSVSIQGAGWQTTDFFPTPDFDLTTCTGGGKTSCIGPGDIMLRDFQFIGFGLASTTVSTTTATIFTALTPAMLLNISCQQFAVNDANLTGFTISSSLFYMSNVQSSNCGALGPSFGAGASAGSVFASYFVPIGGSMTVTAATPGPDFYTTWIAPSSVNECASNISGFANFFGLAGQIGGSGSEMCVAGGTVTFHGSHLFHNQGIAGRAALKITAGGTATAANSSFSDAGAGEFSVSVDATSTFVDGCGNTYTGAVNVSVGGKFIPCPSTVYPSGSVLQLVGATGTGACATITTIKGHIFSGSLTCTGSTGASTIVLTPGQTAVNGWRCSADDMTTNTNLPHQSANNQTTCTLTVASVSANDVITFQLAQF
jgi:hypothetical protein